MLRISAALVTPPFPLICEHILNGASSITYCDIIFFLPLFMLVFNRPGSGEFSPSIQLRVHPQA